MGLFGNKNYTTVYGVKIGPAGSGWSAEMEEKYPAKVPGACRFIKNDKRCEKVAESGNYYCRKHIGA